MKSDPPQHGGARRYWADHYGVPLEQMIDLSTGINPHGWSVPEIPPEVWQRLPEIEPKLIQAAADYYGSDALLPIAGTQTAIQTLPQLRPLGRVGVLSPSYSEHQAGWESAGHAVTALTAEQIESSLPGLDVLVVVNPNNPTGERFSKERLLHWHQQLADRGGWLVVDEAFIDTTPEQSLCRLGDSRTGLLVLRSLGKFFGLAGVRCGFLFTTESLRTRLSQQLGPWSLSHPAQWVARHALQDRSWQQKMVESLAHESARLQQLLDSVGMAPQGGTPLFQWVVMEDAEGVFDELAQQGILVRKFDQPRAIRFGLPASESEWQKLSQALQSISSLRAVA